MGRINCKPTFGRKNKAGGGLFCFDKGGIHILFDPLYGMFKVSRRKVIFSVLGGLAVMMFFAFTACAGGLKGTVPEGTEIKDPYIEQLFAPEFPYEWVKVIDTKEGDRFVVVKAKMKITTEMHIEYEQRNTLKKRNMTILRDYNPHTGALPIAEVKLSRKISDKPFVIEYCVANPKNRDPEKNISWRDGKYLIIWIDKNFGKVFKKVEIYPEKDAPCPPPPYVGKYPNSRSLVCVGGGKGFVFNYVSKDKAEDIYKYYRDKLESHYKKVGFNFPEKKWEYMGSGHNLGMQIKNIDVDQWGNYLDEERKGKSTKSAPSYSGVVLNIVIYKGSPRSFIEEFSFIRIYYSVDPETIRKNKELWGK